MKKGLVLLLVILILTNFHCARFRIGTTGSESVLASCSAALLDFSGDTVELKKGRIFLSGKSLLFKYRGEIKNIPYSDISTIEVDGSLLSGIPNMPEPDFNGDEKKKSAFLAIGLLVLLAVLVFIFYVLVPDAGIDMNIHIDSDSGLETASFLLARGELAKIYPLLMDKVDR